MKIITPRRYDTYVENLSQRGTVPEQALSFFHDKSAAVRMLLTKEPYDTIMSQVGGIINKMDIMGGKVQ